MPYKDLPEGQTHSYNDGCGEPEHNMTTPKIEDREVPFYCEDCGDVRPAEKAVRACCRTHLEQSLQTDKSMTTMHERFDEALEKFANQEHIRWAKWQNYLHSFLTWNNDIQAWVLPHEKKEHWQRQINTPYSMLSEKEKDSDREQVKPYLVFIQSEIDLAKKEAYMECVNFLDRTHKDCRLTSTCIGYQNAYSDLKNEFLPNPKDKYDKTRNTKHNKRKS